MSTGGTISGFRHAPVTKGLLFTTAGASVFAQAARASRRQIPVGLQAASQLFVLKNPAELVFGAFLLYYFRVLERQMGSSKFGAFAFLAATFSYASELGLAKLAGLRAFPSGPYGVIFACFVQFFSHVPASSKFTVLGWRMSDKAFIYLAGTQMLLSGGTGTLLAGGAGLLAGLLYRFNVLGIKRFRLPKLVTRLFTAVLGPLLSDSGSSGNNGAGAAAAGAGVAGAAAGASAPGGRPGATGVPGGVAAPGRGGLGAGVAAPAAVPEEALQQLLAMGFNEAQALRALELANNDVGAAIALLV